MKAVVRLLALITLFIPAALWAVAPLRMDTVAEARLQRGGLALTPDRLITYLNQRAPTDTDRQLAARLIPQLGDDSFTQRQTAARELADLGILALPALRQHSKHRDIEIRRAVGQLLEQAERTTRADTDLGFPLSQAVVRVLADSRHPEAAQTLLRYLPFADCPETEEEIYYALETLHQHGQRAPLVAALRDGASARRAVAACILARCGDAEVQKQAHGCLWDKDARVRLRAAQGVLASSVPDKAALPVLIDLLREEAVEVTWQAEELLRFAVGRLMPREVVGANTREERDRCWRAWKSWWKDREPFVDLSNLPRSKRRPGLALAYQCQGYYSTQKDWRLRVYGWEGVPRYVREVPQVGRVLYVPSGAFQTCVCEKEKWFVLQHDLLGGLQWRYHFADRGKSYESSFADAPALQPLPGGKTVVSNWERLVVVDAQGQGASPLTSHANARFRWARVSPDGRILGEGGLGAVEISLPRPSDSDEMPYLDYLSALDAIDPESGTKKQSITLDSRVCSDRHRPRQMNLLPTGEFYASVYGRGYRPELAEFDRQGRRVRTTKYPGWVVARFRNGHILVQQEMQLLELSPDDRVVWEAFSEDLILSAQSIYPLVRFGFTHSGRPGADLNTWASRVQSLHSENVLVRRKALEYLDRVDRKRAAKLPELVMCLRDPDPGVRSLVFRIWRESLDVPPPEAVPTLVYLLALGGECANYPTGSLSRPNDGVVPALLAATKRQPPDAPESLNSKRNASWALARHAGRGDARAVAAVKSGLTDRDAQTRSATVDGLNYYLDKVAGFLDELLRVAETDEVLVANKALYQLCFCGKQVKPPTERLLKLLDKSDRRPAVMSCLVSLAQDDARTLPAILRYSGDKQDAATSAAVMRSLGVYAEKKEVMAELIRGLKDHRCERPDIPGDTTVRWYALRTLAQAGPVAKQALPDVRRIVMDEKEDKETREIATEALRAIEGREKSGEKAGKK